MFKDMSRAALSVFIMGLYLIFLGITFLFFPQLMFTILAEPNPPDVVSRVLGMIFLFLAYYLIRAALEGGEEMKKFFMWTVHTRASVIIFLIIFVVLRYTSPLVILFGVIDLVLALWTFWELRKEKK